MDKPMRYCPCCNRELTLRAFYKSILPEGGYLPYCMNCCNDKYKEYLDRLSNTRAAIWCVLAELRLPFLKEVWEKTEYIIGNSTALQDVFKIYYRTMQELGYVPKGFWESDMMLTDFFAKPEKDESTKKREVVNRKKDEADKEKILKWGKFEKDGKLDDEAYLFLEATMENYTKDLDYMDANTENRYRDLARCELRLRRANEAGEGAEISKAQDSLNKQLALLGLNIFKKQETDERKLFIDRMAWLIENTEPAELEDENAYRDEAGYEKIYNSFMRSMRNILTGDRKYPNIPKDET